MGRGQKDKAHKSIGHQTEIKEEIRVKSASHKLSDDKSWKHERN